MLPLVGVRSCLSFLFGLLNDPVGKLEKEKFEKKEKEGKEKNNEKKKKVKK